MRMVLTLLSFVSVSAAAIEIPDVPASALTERQACDIKATEPNEVRVSVFNGWRQTWTVGHVTFVVTKGERIGRDGSRVLNQTRLRRESQPVGTLTRELTEWTTVLTVNGETTQTETVQDELWRVNGDRRELVSRVKNGNLVQNAREVIQQTSEGFGYRETTTTSVEGESEYRWFCTFSVPRS